MGRITNSLLAVSLAVSAGACTNPEEARAERYRGIYESLQQEQAEERDHFISLCSDATVEYIPQPNEGWNHAAYSVPGVGSYELEFAVEHIKSLNPGNIIVGQAVDVPEECEE